MKRTPQEQAVQDSLRRILTGHWTLTDIRIVQDARDTEAVKAARAKAATPWRPTVTTRRQMAANAPKGVPSGQKEITARAAAWRETANARLAERHRLNGGYSKGNH